MCCLEIFFGDKPCYLLKVSNRKEICVKKLSIRKFVFVFVGTVVLITFSLPVLADWNIQTVDSAGNVGMYDSLAIDSSDNSHISYRGKGGLVKHAFRSFYPAAMPWIPLLLLFD